MPIALANPAVSTAPGTATGNAAPATPAAATATATVSAPASVAVSPAPPVSRKPSREATEIAEINERLAVMAARLSELELQAKIATKQSEIKKITVPQDEGFLPSVLEISGIEGKVSAIVTTQEGGTQVVRVGDTVGTWRVTEIRVDSVSVRRGNSSARLGFAHTQRPTQPSANPLPNSVLPPFPSR
jgi:hypothetical protein